MRALGVVIVAILLVVSIVPPVQTWAAPPASPPGHEDCFVRKWVRVGRRYVNAHHIPHRWTVAALRVLKAGKTRGQGLLVKAYRGTQRISFSWRGRRYTRIYDVVILAVFVEKCQKWFFALFREGKFITNYFPGSRREAVDSTWRYIRQVVARYGARVQRLAALGRWVGEAVSSVATAFETYMWLLDPRDIVCPQLNPNDPDDLAFGASFGCWRVKS